MMGSAVELRGCTAAQRKDNASGTQSQQAAMGKRGSKVRLGGSCESITAYRLMMTW
jgi:hypothetical protein